VHVAPPAFVIEPDATPAALLRGSCLKMTTILPVAAAALFLK
jgi:hypothetical protein